VQECYLLFAIRCGSNFYVSLDEVKAAFSLGGGGAGGWALS